jgi:hypothetical protein
MRSEQYEELCRVFISQQVGLDVAEVKSGLLPNPQRLDQPAYRHQVDLYWETGDAIGKYFNIANAKWRASAKVDQPEVMLLAKVREKLAAQKAFMITSTGFTAGAIAAARDEGIALHVVSSELDVSSLPLRSRPAIRAALQEVQAGGGVLYTHTAECRGLGFRPQDTADPAAHARPAPSSPHFETRVAPPPATRAVGGGEQRGGASPRTGGFESRERKG